MKIFSFIFIAFFILSCTPESRKGSSGNLSSSSANDEKRPVADSARTRNKEEEALLFCKRKNLSTDFCLLIEMSLHSGVKRLFIWNFEKNKVTGEYLVGHGCGQTHGARTPQETVRNSVMKMAVIFLHWENTNFRKGDPANGESM